MAIINQLEINRVACNRLSKVCSRYESLLLFPPSHARAAVCSYKTTTPLLLSMGAASLRILTGDQRRLFAHHG